MKNFNYTARDKSGATKRGSLQAADRNAAMKELVAQGMVPLSVNEGQAGSNSTCPQVPLRYVFLSIAILVLGVAFFIVSQMKARPSGSAKNRRTTSTTTTARVVKKGSGENGITSTKKVENKETPVNHSATPPVTNLLQRLARPNNMRVIKISSSQTNEINSLSTFRTRAERIMSNMLGTPPGDRIIELDFGNDFQSDFKNSLTNIIEVYATDNEDVDKLKQNVAWMKDEIRKLVKEGESAEALLKQFREEHNKVADLRDDLQRQLTALKKAGLNDEAEKFAEQANEQLKPYGVRPLRLYLIQSKENEKSDKE